MRIGVLILPEYRWLLAEPKWRAAESYGFDHAWTYDHLGWRSLVDGPWFDAVPTLTAAAMVTRRIRLGPLTAERTSISGEYYTSVRARSAPGCVRHPRIPFVVAANGPRSMRLAARHGQGWITSGRRGGDLEAWWRGVRLPLAAGGRRLRRPARRPGPGRRRGAAEPVRT